MINRNSQNYLFGNRVINNKLVIKDLFNAVIIEELKYKFLLLRDIFTTIKARELYVSREKIYNSIEAILKDYSPYISSSAINYSIQSNTIIFYVLLYLNNLADVISVEISVNIE
jgi:hypothetical protein